jgi:glycosyltransferase involved in cell wall biosynthesis
MPSVLFVTPFIWEAGPWRGKPTVYYIIRGLQRAGYEVHVVTATNKREITDITWEGVHIHYFRLPLGPMGFEFDAFHSFLTQVSQAANAWRRHLTFRLLWLQFVLLGWRRDASCLALAARIHLRRQQSRHPIAYGVGRRLEVPNFSRIMGSPILQWLGSPVRLYLARFDELLAFKLPAEALIITDDGTISVADIRERLGIPDERIWMYRNGIDKASFTSGPLKPQVRAELGLPQDAKVLLWVSQLVNWKRVDRIIDAMPEVAAHCPAVQLVILGDGPDRQPLEAQADRLGVRHLVRFEGFVAGGVAALFHSADLFTAFYDYANVSNSLLEAMLSGITVVALDNGHTSEVVKHMENGLLVDPRRIGDIPETVTRVLVDDELRERLSRNAAAYADRVLLTWDERIDKEIAMIEAAVLDRERRRPPIRARYAD